MLFERLDNRTRAMDLDTWNDLPAWLRNVLGVMYTIFAYVLIYHLGG